MLYLIDSSVYIFRAYFSLPDSIVDRDGNPMQAAYGFMRFLIELLERERPRYIACAFDESLTSSFRNGFYPDYKANRDLPPPELEQQLNACRRIAKSLGIATFASKRYEADDLIGTLAKRHRAKNRPVTIVTRDKDLAQLVRENDCFWDFAADARHDVTALTARLGVRPAQVPDLLGLAGDPVDNIPGVRGVGLKTAAALLQHFENLDALYLDLGAVAQLPLRGARSVAARLEADRERAFLSRQLATVHCDVPLHTTLADLRWHKPAAATLRRLATTLGVGGNALDRIARLTRC